jgi:response regulator RpfG family c-di-GMP phosphodiesterase
MIQLIEDDFVTCHIITALLRRLQYSCCEAHTGEEAIEQLRTRPIDLVIMDMVLPDIHGLELLERKHRLPAVSDIPVLCCTAEADIETVEAAMGLGAIDFVKKPIVLPVFSARISRAVEFAPTRWESGSDTTGQPHRSYARTAQPMLVIASHVLRELDDALALAQEPQSPDTSVTISELNAMVTRARGAALNVGAARTVRQLDRLWQSKGTSQEITDLRSALLIEFAGFDEAIQAEASQPELMVVHA